MARNAEKQQGKLNRLWLQKERDEGRLKDVHERRPKLSTLNSAASLKKWIPSIKKEIEYYLQQSQLSHYPERKIAEFQLRMEALEREYKRFTTKLRVVDPACKHKPWTPRAYCKKSPGIVTPPRPRESHDGSGQLSDSAGGGTGCHKPSSDPGRKPPLGVQTLVPADPNSEAACADQDRPLTFDHARLAVAAAAFRGPPPPRGSAQTRSLARVLHSGLPNLSNAAARLTILGSAVAQKGAAEDREERTGHVLGLDCYSSSDEERDT
ncbi:uncharacterized protein LOC117729631 [Cyclopterus lumpus]|uniref:uncharacterized protein LOC117729631 n=1 Tax=Cyclopterus lumpus TaxID=8103 RepID=UPI001486D75D|nr:uncharacterized protein LOC117729631 [Cyclopterus lumpus]